MAALVAYSRPAAAQVADLSVIATSSAGTISLGRDVTYTVLVTNSGPSDATQVDLTDTLSTGLTLVSASTTQGSCGPLVRVLLDNQITCALGTIPAGGVATVSLVVTAIAERFVGFITSDARVSSAVADSTLTNNSAHVFTSVVVPSLAVTKTGSGSGAVTSSPAGIDCGTSCTAQFPDGGPVTLTAVAAAESKFDGWTGAGCSGTATCTVDVNAAMQVTATFTSGSKSGGCGSSGSGTALSLVGLAPFLAARARRRQS